MSPQNAKMCRPSSAHETSSQNAKVVLLGDAYVGKTSIVMRLIKNDFQHNQEATVGAAFSSKSIELKDQTVKLNIWDTGGQERYNSLAPMYFRNAEAAIVVYDITSADSVSKAKEWIHKLLEKAPKDIVIFLAGNKLDLASNKREVSEKDGKALAENESLTFAEVSAKTGEGIAEMFISLAKAIALHQKDSRRSTSSSRGTVVLGAKSKSGKCAC